MAAANVKLMNYYFKTRKKWAEETENLQQVESGDGGAGGCGKG